MNLVKMFTEWMSDLEEQKNFKEMWIKKHNNTFQGQTDAMDEYHCFIAYQLMKLQEEIDLLKAKNG